MLCVILYAEISGHHGSKEPLNGLLLLSYYYYLENVLWENMRLLSLSQGFLDRVDGFLRIRLRNDNDSIARFISSSEIKSNQKWDPSQQPFEIMIIYRQCFKTILSVKKWTHFAEVQKKRSNQLNQVSQENGFQTVCVLRCADHDISLFDFSTTT